MKKFKAAASKICPHDSESTLSTTSTEDSGTFSGDDTSPAWTTGQEFQFYVPWLWKDSSEPPPEELQSNGQVVRVPRLTNLPGFTEEFREAWIQQSVSTAVKDLVYDKDNYPTCIESQLERWRYKKTEAWKHFNIVQRQCNLPKMPAPPGYDGVLPMEITIAIKEMSVRRDQASSVCSVEWLTLPTPGMCIQRIKNQVRIFLTPECSLHVHIRPRTILDFDLQSFKKMASLLWLAEDRLDKLYHPARSNSDSPLHRSLRHHSSLALSDSPLLTSRVDNHADVLQFLDLDLAATERAGLATIWQTINRHQLRELLRVHPSIGKHDYPAYNFFNLFMSSEKQTIEFRKTDSTADGEVIDAWIEVFVLLTMFCMTCSTESFQRVMGNLVKTHRAYSTWHLLGDIGCKEAVIEVLKQKSAEQWLLEEAAPRSTSRVASALTSSRGDSEGRFRFLDYIFKGAEKAGGMIAIGYSYGR